MTSTFSLTMGDRGRIVIPLEVRERLGLDVGAPMALIATDDGIALLSRDRLKELVRRDLSGLDLVGELVDDRRAEADADDRG